MLGRRSHEASQSGAQTQTQSINVDRSRRLRELLQMHAIEAGSLSKSYIAKLPVSFAIFVVASNDLIGAAANKHMHNFHKIIKLNWIQS